MLRISTGAWMQREKTMFASFRGVSEGAYDITTIKNHEVDIFKKVSSLLNVL